MNNSENFDPVALRAKYRVEREKRLRPEGAAQYRVTEGAYAHFLDDPYVEPGYTREPLSEEVDVVVIGGGFGGLMAAVRLRRAGIDSFRIIEKAGDFGGTWYWNRYPGIACDIESYIYMPLLEELGTIPTEKYARGAEILRHTWAIGEKFGLYDNALFQTEVTELRWNDTQARWLISSIPVGGTTPIRAAIPPAGSWAWRTIVSASSAPAPPRCNACPISAWRLSTYTCSSGRRRRLMSATIARPTNNGPIACSPAGNRRAWTISTP
jgi:hypothetical protein